MHQPDELKSLSYWEEVNNPLILHNTPTHMQPEQGANVEIKKGAEDLKDVSTKTRTRDLTMLGFMHQPDELKSLSYWEEVGNPLILHNKNLMVTTLVLNNTLSAISLADCDFDSYS